MITQSSARHDPLPRIARATAGNRNLRTSKTSAFRRLNEWPVVPRRRGRGPRMDFSSVGESVRRFAGATKRHSRKGRLVGRRTLDEHSSSPRPARRLLSPPSRRYTEARCALAERAGRGAVTAARMIEDRPAQIGRNKAADDEGEVEKDARAAKGKGHREVSKKQDHDEPGNNQACKSECLRHGSLRFCGNPGWKRDAFHTIIAARRGASHVLRRPKRWLRTAAGIAPASETHRLEPPSRPRPHGRLYRLF